MRTMSLPLIFPAVEMDGKILVDGGAMNNVPADVTRGMGADIVIAINVGDLSDPKEINQTLLGLAGGTLGAMMRASTKEGLAAADVVLDVPLVEKGYKSLDWRRSKELVEEGYKAAEAIKDQLLKYAVSEAEYQKWLARRNGARRATIPAPAFVRFEGVVSADEQRMGETLRKHVGRPLDIQALELDLTELAGLDRYRNGGLAPGLERGRRGGIARAGTRQAVRAPVPDARPHPRKHHERQFRRLALGPLPELRPPVLGRRTPGGRHDRIGSLARHGMVPAARQDAAFLRAVRRYREADVQRRPGRVRWSPGTTRWF